MRDIIWTLILVWFIYKIVDIFRSNNSRKNSASYQEEPAAQRNQPASHDIKNAIKKQVNNEGEYIDFEEVK